MTFEIFDHSDEETWPKQFNLFLLLTIMKSLTVMTIMTIIDNSNKDNDKDKTGTCDIWDTDNNSDNWEPESMTIFVIWQSIVTLDSICNSCDVSSFWLFALINKISNGWKADFCKLFAFLMYVFSKRQTYSWVCWNEVCDTPLFH